MLKKFGMVTVGVTAGLLAVAPMASASEDHGDNNTGDQEGTGNIQCNAEGDGVDNDVENRGLLSVGQVVGPIGSGNTGQLLSCNSFLNDFLNDNEVNILSSDPI